MLRTRLFFYLAPFVAILLAVGICAVVLFAHITRNVDLTVTGNYRSVLAVQEMKLALTKMEDAVLQTIENSGDAPFNEREFTDSQKTFETNLETQLANGKTQRELDLNRRLRAGYQAFARSAVNILLQKDAETQRRAYKESLLPNMDDANRMLDQIHRLNHQAILATTDHVREITVQATKWMLAGTAVALLLALYAGYKLARSILKPIQALTGATRALGEGNLDQLVPVRAHDELGELAESFNKMAGQLRLYRQSTAEKIVRLHRTMEATLASFPDPIFVLNREGTIELMNLAATELTQALELKDALPESVREKAKRALAEGESFLPHSFKEVVSFRLNGQEKFYLPRVLSMRNEDNALLGVAVALYDVTRFRLLDDAKTNLVATVSHEIKTPLTSVRMALHLLLEKTLGTLTPKQNYLLETAREDAERLLRILNDLLDLTRLEQGTELHTERTAPAELAQSMTDQMREAAGTREVKLVCTTEDHLPPIMVDRQRITYVFSNLIHNAIKYSPPGGEILLRATRTGERDVQFSVIDKGPGVPEDYQERIFDRFYRVPGQARKGAGLGLSIAREIVLAHGGRIAVRNVPEGGSEFYFILSGADAESSENGEV